MRCSSTQIPDVESLPTRIMIAGSIISLSSRQCLPAAPALREAFGPRYLPQIGLRLQVRAQADKQEQDSPKLQATNPLRAPPRPLGPADVRRDTAHILANQTSPEAVEEATRQKFLGRLAIVLLGVSRLPTYHRKWSEHQYVRPLHAFHKVHCLGEILCRLCCHSMI